MRGDLANILYQATRDQTEYIFDDSIVGLRECEDGVNVTFDRNPPRKFDLVFGADGLHSKVRALAFGKETDYMHHLGLYIAIFTTPQFPNLGMDGLYYGVPGKRMGIFGARNGTEAKASFYFTSDAFAYNYRDTEQQKQIISARFTGEKWHTEQLLELMDTAPDFYFDSISQIKMDSWSKGRIALLGDAAYCASPMSGMGTGMAFIGAYILAGELKAANGDYQAAFTSYETQMRDFVKNCQDLADGVEWFVPKTRFKQWMSRQLWRLLPYTPWKNMMIELPLKVANSITVKAYSPE
jgi:2-polyprenyl-6-methoxyphenol hydroxylase-like FAD-dependent oxidoreductase